MDNIFFLSNEANNTHEIYIVVFRLILYVELTFKTAKLPYFI